MDGVLDREGCDEPSAVEPLDEEPAGLSSDVEPPDEVPEEPPELGSPSRGFPAPRSEEPAAAEPALCDVPVGASADRASGSTVTEATAALVKPAGDEREPVGGDGCTTETRPPPSCSVIEQPGPFRSRPRTSPPVPTRWWSIAVHGTGFVADGAAAATD
ncbi:MAG: hypothetical protein JNM77_09725 [Pseudonocardia sp.]|nr:hypothetical protein [Pseudonocardia sp.]